jgi:hypothetical protein
LTLISQWHNHYSNNKKNDKIIHNNQSHKTDNINKKKTLNESGMVAHAYKLSTWEVETGGLSVQGQSGLHNETLSQKPKTKQTKKSPEEKAVNIFKNSKKGGKGSTKN